MGVVDRRVHGIGEITGVEHSSGGISEVPRGARTRTHVGRAVSHRCRGALEFPRTQRGAGKCRAAPRLGWAGTRQPRAAFPVVTPVQACGVLDNSRAAPSAGLPGCPKTPRRQAASGGDSGIRAAMSAGRENPKLSGPPPRPCP